jgi:hypothetical protein
LPPPARGSPATRAVPGSVAGSDRSAPEW